MIRESKLDEHHVSALVGFDDSFGSVNGAKIGYLQAILRFVIPRSKRNVHDGVWSQMIRTRIFMFIILHFSSLILMIE